MSDSVNSSLDRKSNIEDLSYKLKEDYNAFYFRIDDLNVEERKEERNQITYLLLENPDNLDLRVKRAIVLRKIGKDGGDENLKIKDLEFVLSKSPNHQHALYNMGISMLEKKDFVSGLEFAEKIITVYGNSNPWAHFLKARHHMYQDELEKPIDLLNKAVEYSKKESVVHVYALESLSFCYQTCEKIKDLVRAEELVRKILEIRPICRVFLRLGRLYYNELKQKDKGYEEFQKVLEINPNYHETHVLIGDYHLYDTKDYEMALYHYLREIEITPKHYAAYSNAGYLFLRDEKYEKALECFTNSIIHSDFEYFYPYSQRGKLYEKMFNDMENAEKDYIKALDLCEKDKDSHSYLPLRYTVLLLFYHRQVKRCEEGEDFVGVYFGCVKYLSTYERKEKAKVKAGGESDERFYSNRKKDYEKRRNSLLNEREDLLRVFFLSESDKKMDGDDLAQRIEFVVDASCESKVCFKCVGREVFVPDFVMNFGLFQ